MVDSFLDCDMQQLIQFHCRRGATATLGLARVPDSARYGTVELAADGAVTGFSEKGREQAPGFINGGVYVISRSVLDAIPDGVVSLEKDSP